MPFFAAGVGAVDGPVDTPWNSTDLNVPDPDGCRLVHCARRPAERRDAAFDALLRDRTAAG
jgi:hypothetical protein